MIDFTSRTKRLLGQDLDKRLAAYGAMAAAVAAGSATTAQAAVIVHDVADITTAPNGSVFFNMTGGNASATSTAGMNFQLSFGSFTFSAGNQHRNAGGYGLTTSAQFAGFSYAYRLATSQTIGSNAFSSFLDGSNYMLAHVDRSSGGIVTYAYGYWQNAGNGAGRGFLGLRFQIAGATHFGWADITVNPNLSVTLHAFGYEDTPRGSIHLDAPVPEPHSAALLALGAAGLLAYRRRRKTA